MKTIVITIADPADGDLVIVNAEAIVNGTPSGKTSVKHSIIGPRKQPILDALGFATGFVDIPAQTPRDVAASLAEQINKEWMPECAQAKVKEGKDSGSLVINCTDLFSNTKFTLEVQGDGGTIASMDEF